MKSTLLVSIGCFGMAIVFFTLMILIPPYPFFMYAVPLGLISVCVVCGICALWLWDIERKTITQESQS